MKYFAYIRVSTPRQGQTGVSLPAQRDAITRYAQQHRLSISTWFEEKQTAAKHGRPVFNQMLELLKKHQLRGIIIHKIDRSARNLRDWANLGELIDQGVDIRFAGDNLDLHSRGGRLAADIQAVVAADFIRNLKEETRKGMVARLEQGIWPARAALGYIDNGPGKVKTVHPIQGPLVKQAFELYATGSYSLRTLAGIMNDKGMANIEGGPVSCDTLSKVFRNRFYMGILQIGSDGPAYPGIHEPLVSPELFAESGRVLNLKLRRRIVINRHLFSVTFRCLKCNRYLIAEKHKQRYMYYRCHTKKCLAHGFREELIREIVSRRMITLGRAEDSAIVQRGDFWKTREIVSKLTGEISFGEAGFRIDPLSRF